MFPGAAEPPFRPAQGPERIRRATKAGGRLPHAKVQPSLCELWLARCQGREVFRRHREMPPYKRRTFDTLGPAGHSDLFTGGNGGRGGRREGGEAEHRDGGKRTSLLDRCRSLLAGERNSKPPRQSISRGFHGWTRIGRLSSASSAQSAEDVSSSHLAAAAPRQVNFRPGRLRRNREVSSAANSEDSVHPLRCFAASRLRASSPAGNRPCPAVQ